MKHAVKESRLVLASTLVVLAFAGCEPTPAPNPGGGSGGSTGAKGGTQSSGGSVGSGGTSSARTGGATGTGGATSSGGAPSSGGTTGSGGATGSGGSSSVSSGGRSGTGGSGSGGSGGSGSGGTSTTGGMTSGSGGASATGGATGRDAGTTGGATTAMGGSGTGGMVPDGGPRDARGTGGVTSTGGAGTGGATSNGGATSTGNGKVFSQCRFHFGTIDSKAKSGGATLISQLDFFTPGWMMGTWNQGYVCTEAVAGGALAGLVPVDVTYIAANYVKNQNKLCDCNVSGCAGGNLCNYGSQYITQDWAAILAAYTSNSTGFAACLGGRPIIFEMEPDWYQYTGGGQSQPWSAATAGTNMTALVNALKSSLPNAYFSMDISPWIANNGSGWYPNFNMGLFTFINTSGGGTDANNTKIRSNNAMTWAGVNQVTGKPILADTGYGAAGASAGEDANWNVAANINARIADGVVSISQYNPGGSWASEISSIRSQLNTPRYCP